VFGTNDPDIVVAARPTLEGEQASFVSSDAFLLQRWQQDACTYNPNENPLGDGMRRFELERSESTFASK